MVNPNDNFEKLMLDFKYASNELIYSNQKHADRICYCSEDM